MQMYVGHQCNLGLMITETDMGTVALTTNRRGKVLYRTRLGRFISFFWVVLCLFFYFFGLNTDLSHLLSHLPPTFSFFKKITT